MIMRKIRQILMTTAVLISSAMTSWAEPYSGTPVAPKQINYNYAHYGLSADYNGYYIISTAEELYGFAELVNGGTNTANAILTADIVVNENVLNDDGTLNGTPTYSWTPIGTNSKKFLGTFDGYGHTISGLYFNDTTNSNYPDGGNYVGLTGFAYFAKIKNVGVIDSYISGYQYVGSICGDGNSSTTTNCYNTGTVSGSNYVGGLCGESGTLTNCYNTGTVLGHSNVGGICGYICLITNCYNTGTVSCTGGYVGGICGVNGIITNCYNTGTVSCNTLAGGICGDGGTLTSCFNTGEVKGRYPIGGICAIEGKQTDNCYYLEGCGSQNTFGVSATAEEFASGKITYLLNGSKSVGDLAWYQAIGTDALPVWNKNHGVVYATQPCISVFSNVNSSARKEHPSMDATGHCTDCGKSLVQGTLVTDNNYSGLNLTADFVGYYAISNSADLYWFANEVNNGKPNLKAVLTADIVVNENVLNDDGTLNGTPTYSWTPIGTSDYKYAGTFDGNGHTISGLCLNDRGYYVGLIGYANEATIKNVGLIDSYISGYQHVGGICGHGSNTNTNIINCFNTGTVFGSTYGSRIGGICGESGTQTNCYNTGMVSGPSVVGGICGIEGVQNNCYNMGTVSASYAGGICGEYGTQINCHNTGTVSGYSYVGGICGNGSGGSQTNCHNTGTVSGTQVVGGICGSAGTQNNCYNTGTVSGSYCAGGICGYDGNITNSYNTGTISGYLSVGGICGSGSDGSQTNCYYLAGCATDGNSVVQYGVGNATSGQSTADIEGKTKSATIEEFANGKIAYLLNGSTFEVTTWRQTLFADASPVLDATHNAVIGYFGEVKNIVTVYGNVVLTTDYTIANGKKLSIPEGASLTTTGEAIITNNGTLLVAGEISGNDLAGDGRFYYALLADADITLNTTSCTYKGTAYKIGNGLDITYATHTLCGKNFDYNGKPTVTYDANTNAGTATVTWNGTISRTFTITAKEIALVWENTVLTYNGSAQKPTATVDGLIGNDECTVTVTGAQTNVGTDYTATASVLSNSNYALPEDVTATFVINKGVPVYTVPENLAILCNQTLADVVLPEGFAFVNVGAELVIGENIATVTFTPKDVDNYNVVEGIEVKVTKAHDVATDAAVAATCTETGLTEGSHCSVCEVVFVAQTETPAAGHTIVVDEAVAATATTDGLTEGSHCSVCHETIVAQEVIPALGGQGGTAVADEAATAVSIYAYQNIIIVEAADAIEGEIAVFDVNGRMVVKTLAAGSRTEIQMQRDGLYIIRVGGQSKRVIIY